MDYWFETLEHRFLLANWSALAMGRAFWKNSRGHCVRWINEESDGPAMPDEEMLRAHDAALRGVRLWEWARAHE